MNEGPSLSFLEQPVALTDYLCNWSKRFSYIYVEAPKVACTTIKLTLQEAELGFPRILEDPSEIHSRSQSPLLSPSDDLDHFLRAVSGSDFFKFCFVRNPFTRSLSCWLDKFVQNDVEKKRLSPLLGLDPDVDCSFVEFLLAVRAQKDEERDIHWATQQYLLRRDIVDYSFIGRFESFDFDFRKVCFCLDLPIFKSVITPDAHRTGAKERLIKYFDQRAISLIKEIYSKDFEAFSYGTSVMLA